MNKLVGLGVVAMIGIPITQAQAGSFNGVDNAYFVFYDNITQNYTQNSGSVNPGFSAGPQNIQYLPSASASGSSAAVGLATLVREDFSRKYTDWFWDTSDPVNDPSPSCEPAYGFHTLCPAITQLVVQAMQLPLWNIGTAVMITLMTLLGIALITERAINLTAAPAYNDHIRVRDTFRTDSSVSTKIAIDLRAGTAQAPPQFTGSMSSSMMIDAGLDVVLTNLGP